jgi:glycogen(starch) synthase
MRVLHLTTEFPPVIYGGLGTAVGGWVGASASSGIDVGVLLVEGPLVLGEGRGYWGGHEIGTAAVPRIVESEGITFFQTEWAHAVETGVSVVERFRPDIVHLHTAMLWPVAREIQRRTKRPLVYHVHSVDRAEYEIGEEPNLWLAHSEAQEDAIAAAGRLIALSGSERDLLADYYPAARARIRVVGNGIADTEAARNASERHRPPAARVVVLYSGRLVERKGIRDLLAAAPLVLSAVPSVRFVLVGGPPPLSGEEVARQWLPDDLAGERERIFFTGWLSPNRVAEWYRSADVLVVPSRYEPFGMVLLEGMLHGLAVVASATGGPVEIVRDGESGLLFPPRDVAELAERLIRVATSTELRERLGREAAADVRERWAWPARVGRMREVYRELLPASEATRTSSAVLVGT